MNVCQISNNQPTYKGYVPKLTEEKVYQIAQEKYDLILIQANRDKVQVDENKLKAVLEQGKRIINKLNQFITPCHKDTSLTIGTRFEPIEGGGRRVSRYFLTINNPIDRPIRTMPRGLIKFPEGNPRILYRGIDYFDDFDYRYDTLIGINGAKEGDHLDKIEHDIDLLLSGIKPEEIDNAFLTRAKKEVVDDAKREGYSNPFIDSLFERLENYWQKWHTKRRAVRLDKYAQEIGQSADCKEQVEATYANAGQRHKETERQILADSRISEENDMIAKRVKNEFMNRKA